MSVTPETVQCEELLRENPGGCARLFGLIERGKLDAEKRLTVKVRASRRPSMSEEKRDFFRRKAIAAWERRRAEGRTTRPVRIRHEETAPVLAGVR